MTHTVVVDASVAVKWLVREPDSDRAFALRMLRMVAPALLVAECGSALWRKVKAGDLDADDAAPRLRVLRGAPVLLQPDHELAQKALPLAVELEHPIYDCMYVALAIELSAPLITADKKLASLIRNRMPDRCRVIGLHEIETQLY
ncbi:tRNA(fMet)-specific endonuclease VapC [Fundidesulfovibrio magnetotacticus]|uniref:Ribonuclease VapC n=1 Tax=Fundidesulfovibrio magnetotacticus TaxID=2730080 RepID=A0A6V8LR95_9BACT|nr:type II toxin-antitoxin system VapC family toxin [Fundidesulfovibrio magnetotacticus]GFK92649.1 tRNA(fMet)-specific endonuclease VapC [Fundidesulfovibrio magnetotacticus]